ncbi:MAG TPA: DUF2569 domain-containing protein [Moraxellaceae bacterium]
MTTADNDVKGIGGWLILPAIGLIAIPIQIALSFYTDYLPIFRDGGWELLTTPGSEHYHPLWARTIVYEIIGSAAYLLFGLYVAFLFFSKSYKFPAFMIVLLVANIVLAAGSLYLADLIPAIEAGEKMQMSSEITRAVLSALIWIPYFVVSKRVKNTFVRPESGHQPAPDYSS